MKVNSIVLFILMIIFLSCSRPAESLKEIELEEYTNLRKLLQEEKILDSIVFDTSGCHIKFPSRGYKVDVYYGVGIYNFKKEKLKKGLEPLCDIASKSCIEKTEKIANDSESGLNLQGRESLVLKNSFFEFVIYPVNNMITGSDAPLRYNYYLRLEVTKGNGEKSLFEQTYKDWSAESFKGDTLTIETLNKKVR